MRGRAKRRATGALVGVLTAMVLVVLASVPSARGAGATTPLPPPTVGGTIVPGTVIIRATTTPAPAAPSPTAAPRTNPPATQAPRSQATAAAARTTVSRTTAPPTTEAPTTVATTTAPATTEAPSTTEATVVGAVTPTAAASAGDAEASRRNSRIAWALALMGVLVGGLTAWFWFSTRPVPVGMAGLAEMGTSRWWRADARKREQILARSRKGTAPVGDDALLVPLAAVAAENPPPGDLPAWAREPAPAGTSEPVSWPPEASAADAGAGDRTPPGGLPLPTGGSGAAPVLAPIDGSSVAAPPLVLTDPVEASDAVSVAMPWAPPLAGEEAATAGDHG
jgi:hypothetical protein